MMSMLLVVVALSGGSVAAGVGDGKTDAKRARRAPVRSARLTPRRRTTPPARPPRIPKGMQACTRPIEARRDLLRQAGETVRYQLSVEGLSVGTIDFQVVRNGRYEGQKVTEYRSLFRVDSFVASFVPVEGRAASLVPEGQMAPLHAMNSYVMADNVYEEDKTFADQGRSLRSRRTRNGKPSSQQRHFAAPVHDFVSAFYLFRALAPKTSGCTILYGNQRAYTIWFTPKGQEQVQTPAGMRPADRYDIVYGSERSRKPYHATLWLSRDAHRLPYRAELRTSRKLVAEVHRFELGE